MPFHPPPELLVHQTEHWTINQRVDSSLPGYLMVGSRAETNNLAKLPATALSELGGHLAQAQQILTDLFAPIHFYIGRYGHMAGHSIHFHIIPIYDWVAEAFARDERYRVLQEFYTPGYESGSDAPFDGSEMTLFVWREFCESQTSPAISGPSASEAIEMIKDAWPHQSGIVT